MKYFKNVLKIKILNISDFHADKGINNIPQHSSSNMKKTPFEKNGPILPDRMFADEVKT